MFEDFNLSKHIIKLGEPLCIFLQPRFPMNPLEHVVENVEVNEEHQIAQKQAGTKISR